MSKEHKKIYKAGKKWLTTIIVAAIALVGSLAVSNVHADTTSTAQTTIASQQRQQVGTDQQGQNVQQNFSQQDQETTDGNQAPQRENTTTAINQPSINTATLTVSQPKANAGNQWVHYDQGWSRTDNQGNWVYS